MASNLKRKGKYLFNKRRKNIIEFMLKEPYTLTYISKILSKDLTTISKEIKKHRKLKYPEKFNNQNNFCIYRKSMQKI